MKRLPTIQKIKESEQYIGWAGVHYRVTQNKERQNIEQDLKKLILLDSDSNATIFCTRKYVTNVWNVEETMAVGTSGNGQLISNESAWFQISGNTGSIKNQ